MTDIPPPAEAGPLRRGLDALYRFGAIIACACLAALLVVIVAQMVARWSRFTFPGGADYAGYLMAAASFLSFAYALNQGSHIRVGLMLNLLGERRVWLEYVGITVGSTITTLLAWYSVRMVRMSYRFNDVSQGQDAMPLWIVQTPMAIGAIMLALCFIDNLVTLLFTGTSPIAARELEGAESHAE